MSAELGITYSCCICGKDHIRKMSAAALDKEMGMDRKGLCSDACSAAEDQFADVAEKALKMNSKIYQKQSATGPVKWSVTPQGHAVDMVNSPPHYKNKVPGIECIDVTQHFNFCLGNAIKYIWRADMKAGDQDLEKAIWYLQRELLHRRGVIETKQ